MLLVWIWSRTRGIALFQRDDTLIAGLLFGGEIACIFFGLSLITATHMAVFLYTAPCFTALGLHWFVPGERLSRAPRAVLCWRFAASRSLSRTAFCTAIPPLRRR